MIDALRLLVKPYRLSPCVVGSERETPVPKFPTEEIPEIVCRGITGPPLRPLTQLCKMKTVVGTIANAMKVEVWTMPIGMLLLRFLQPRARFGWAPVEPAARVVPAVVCASRSVGLAG